MRQLIISEYTLVYSVYLQSSQYCTYINWMIQEVNNNENGFFVQIR